MGILKRDDQIFSVKIKHLKIARIHEYKLKNFYYFYVKIVIKGKIKVYLVGFIYSIVVIVCACIVIINNKLISFHE